MNIYEDGRMNRRIREEVHWNKTLDHSRLRLRNNLCLTYVIRDGLIGSQIHFQEE